MCIVTKLLGADSNLAIRFGGYQYKPPLTPILEYTYTHIQNIMCLWYILTLSGDGIITHFESNRATYVPGVCLLRRELFGLLLATSPKSENIIAHWKFYAFKAKLAKVKCCYTLGGSVSKLISGLVYTFVSNGMFCISKYYTSYTCCQTYHNNYMDISQQLTRLAKEVGNNWSFEMRSWIIGSLTALIGFLAFLLA